MSIPCASIVYVAYGDISKHGSGHTRITEAAPMGAVGNAGLEKSLLLASVLFRCGTFKADMEKEYKGGLTNAVLKLKSRPILISRA